MKEKYCKEHKKLSNMRQTEKIAKAKIKIKNSW